MDIDENDVQRILFFHFFIFFFRFFGVSLHHFNCSVCIFISFRINSLEMNSRVYQKLYWATVAICFDGIFNKYFLSKNEWKMSPFSFMHALLICLWFTYFHLCINQLTIPFSLANVYFYVHRSPPSLFTSKMDLYVINSTRFSIGIFFPSAILSLFSPYFFFFALLIQEFSSDEEKDVCRKNKFRTKWKNHNSILSEFVTKWECEMCFSSYLYDFISCSCSSSLLPQWFYFRIQASTSALRIFCTIPWKFLLLNHWIIECAK